jgi:D-lactate dehydrogenase (cytochrome)
MNAPPSDPAVRPSPRRAVPPALLEALRQRFGERCSTAASVREQHGRGESVYDAAPPTRCCFAKAAKRSLPCWPWRTSMRCP